MRIDQKSWFIKSNGIYELCYVVPFPVDNHYMIPVLRQFSNFLESKIGCGIIQFHLFLNPFSVGDHSQG